RRLIGYVLESADLAEDLAFLGRSTGLPVASADLERVRPDGGRVRWRGGVVGDFLAGAMPFLIEWRTPRSERFPGGVPAHPNGARALAAVGVRLPDDDAECADAHGPVLARPIAHAPAS